MSIRITEEITATGHVFVVWIDHGAQSLKLATGYTEDAARESAQRTLAALIVKTYQTEVAR